MLARCIRKLIKALQWRRCSLQVCPADDRNHSNCNRPSFQTSHLVLVSGSLVHRRWSQPCRACGKVIGSGTSMRRMRGNLQQHYAYCPAVARHAADTSAGAPPLLSVGQIGLRTFTRHEMRRCLQPIRYRLCVMQRHPVLGLPAPRHSTPRPAAAAAAAAAPLAPVARCC